MRLPNDYDSVKITERSQLGIDKINDSARKLVQNDVSMTRYSMDIPGTWERRWCNSGDTSLYYRKGDAVWINVENIDEFVWKREADIRFYAQGNPYARTELSKADASNDRSKLFEFYKRVVRGEFSNGEPLFYFGDLSKKVQIRISAKDGNSDMPTDEHTKGNAENYSWVDFFDIMDEDAVSDSVKELLGKMESERLLEHLSEYHLSGQENILSRVLRKDLGNVVYGQKYHGHSWYESKLDRGFDCVQTYVRKKYASGSFKWFRIWKSGYLEHGGTVYTQSAKETGDLFDGDGNFMTVNLGWLYGGGSQRAMTYDYVPRSVQSFYQLSPKVDLGQSANSPVSEFTFDRPKTDLASRYRIQVSPIRPGGYSGTLLSPDRFPYIQTMDVFDLKNDSFSVVTSDGSSGYSYQIGGFVEKYS